MKHTPQRKALRGRGTALVMTAPVLLLAAGCGASSTGSATTASARLSPSPSMTSSSAGTTSAASQRSTCTDTAGDGAGADLTGVSIDVDDDDARVTWTTTQTVQGIVDVSPTALFSVTVIRADGNQVFQLGVKSIDGSLDDPFVFDFTTSQQTTAGDAALVDGSTITATFPAETVTSLGPNWKWSAGTSVDGTDVDDCPDESDDVLNPPLITASA